MYRIVQPHKRFYIERALTVLTPLLYGAMCIVFMGFIKLSLSLRKKLYGVSFGTFGSDISLKDIIVSCFWWGARAPEALILLLFILSVYAVYDGSFILYGTPPRSTPEKGND